MTKNPQPPIDPDYSLKTADEIGPHISQVAIDADGDFAILSNHKPLLLAEQLRGVATMIERDIEDNQP